MLTHLSWTCFEILIGMQEYAFYYVFSVTLFVLIVMEHISNALATLLVRLIWGTSGALSAQSLSHLGSVTSAGSNLELFGVILEYLTQELDVRDGDFDSQAHYALEVHTSQWLHSTSSDIKGYTSMQMVGAGVTFFSSLFTSFLSCLLSTISALSVAYIAWASVATIVFTLLFILQENYSEVIIQAVDQYKSSYGALLHKWFFIPLQVSLVRCVYAFVRVFVSQLTTLHPQVFDVMFSSIVPLYDAFIWIVQILFNCVSVCVLYVCMHLNEPDLCILESRKISM